MKTRWLAMMLVGGLFLVGCSNGGGQRVFDFTSASDRAAWSAEGLSYQGSIGPYAVYKVTSATQRLVGPSVRVGSGIVALASAQNYFVAPRTPAPSVRLALVAGGATLLDATETPMDDGQCSPGTTTTSGGDLGSGGGASADMSGWGNPCGSGGHGGGGGGGGGHGSGGSGGYGGGGSGGDGGGGGSGGYGGGGGSGGSYGNPGNLPDGGWNTPGCPTDMGSSGGGGNGGSGGGGSGGNGGGGGSGGTGGSGGSGGSGGQYGGSGGNGGGGDSGGSGGGTGSAGSSGGTGGAGSGNSGGPVIFSTPVSITFPSPAPVGSIILIQRVTLGGGAPNDTPPPPVCCTGSNCTTGGTGGSGGGTTGSGPIQ